jgi:outer membrane protein assembly factor BamB
MLRVIDAYPAPKGVDAARFASLKAELKRLLVARSKDGVSTSLATNKTVSVAPTASWNSVSDLAALGDAAGTQATLTWTEVLPGDYNNDGSVDIGDLVPVALYYGQRTDTGPDDGHKLVVGDADPEISIWDIGPIAQNYGTRLEGYQVWRGHWNGTSTDWETTPRPNPNPANANWSADRPTPPPVGARPTYTYVDDISTLADRHDVRYKVAPYGDGNAGIESAEAIMPPVAFAVSGTVTQAGSGLADVMMTLSPGGATATTQADGTYTIPNMIAGSYTLTPTKSGFAFTPASRDVTISDADMAAQDFVGAPAFSISGTVRESGNLLADVTMTLSPGGRTTTTQADGTYALTGVTDGIYRVTPTKVGYSFTPWNRNVVVSGADVTGVDFSGTATAYSVSGAVLCQGNPLAGVVVTLTPGGLSATTQEDGTYSITGVGNGDYIVTPSKFNYVFAPTRAITVNGADATGVDFAADDAGLLSISGTVTEFGTPIEGVELILTPGALSAVTGADGIFTISGVPQGTLTLTPVGPGYWFSPVNRPENVTGSDITGQDFNAAPTHLANAPWPKFHADSRNTAQSAYLGPQFANLKWTFATGGMVESSPAIGVDGTIYVGSDDYSIYALNPDGSLKWMRVTGGPVKSSPCIGEDGTVYIGSDDGNLYALNPADGSVKWTFPTGYPIRSSANMGPDGSLYIGSDDGNLYALNPADGSEKWYRPVNGWFRCSPAVGQDGTIYVNSFDGNTYAVNFWDGSVKWVSATRVTDSSPSVGADGPIYVGTYHGELLALNPADGTEVWVNMAGQNPISSPAIGLDGVFYFAGGNRVNAARSPVLGGPKWTYSAGYSVASSPAIGADGTVYIGFDDFNVYALDGNTGRAKWKYNTGGVVRSSPAIGADGTLYIGSGDGNLYAFGP